MTRRAPSGVLLDVIEERIRQEVRFPGQHLPDGTGGYAEEVLAAAAKQATNLAAANGTLTWRDVLREEVHEAFAESDLARLRAELVQVAAVCLRWIEDITSRPTPPAPTEESREAAWSRYELACDDLASRHRRRCANPDCPCHADPQQEDTETSD